METPPLSSIVENLGEYGIAQSDAIFAAKLDITGFASSFTNCEQFADYVAHFVTSNRQEPDRLNSMLSMCLNETLEMAYRYHRGEGELWIEVRQAPTDDSSNGALITITSIPADEAAIAAYQWCRRHLDLPKDSTFYDDIVRSGFEGAEHKTGVIELKRIYGINLSIHLEPNKNRVSIIMILPDETQK